MKRWQVEPSMVTSDTHCHLLATQCSGVKIKVISASRGPGKYLGHCGLKHDAFYRQRSRIQHGHNHHQHIGPSWWTFLGEVEEDAEAVFIIGCHRKGTACKKVARGCGRSEQVNNPQQNPGVSATAKWGEQCSVKESGKGLLSELHKTAH